MMKDGKVGFEFSLNELMAFLEHKRSLVQEDPEAWRAEYLAKQAAGVKFEYDWGVKIGWIGGRCSFHSEKEFYREVEQCKPIAEVKESDMKIPEASREILQAWQKQGLQIFDGGTLPHFFLAFDCLRRGNYSIPEQPIPIPKSMSAETVEAMWRQGLWLEVNGKYGWVPMANDFCWNGAFKGAELLKRLRIPAQPIPEKLLEVAKPEAPQEDIKPEIRKWADRYYSLWCFVENSLPNGASSDIFRRYAHDVNAEIYGIQDAIKEPTNPPDEWKVGRDSAEPDTMTIKAASIPHLAERILWLQQREAGTNEVWQVSRQHSPDEYYDIGIRCEPTWMPDRKYRPKPKTVTYYFAEVQKDCVSRNGFISLMHKNGFTIIGNIEEREVEVAK